ncbi:hypothetical protein K402DRAFT_401225 [Aulographum hederae CBS 113979]|uniref:Uncharacterized protein n=1 Tax=Aulographum hederae CBS 113979 TaxID=1176131 RepID=A0A6G1HBI8_9PEZI|nr:hypothetical protein K402DRAFT_401225 [Aulographum hederae CBS 113979]
MKRASERNAAATCAVCALAQPRRTKHSTQETCGRWMPPTEPWGPHSATPHGGGGGGDGDGDGGDGESSPDSVPRPTQIWQRREQLPARTLPHPIPYSTHNPSSPQHPRISCEGLDRSISAWGEGRRLPSTGHEQGRHRRPRNRRQQLFQNSPDQRRPPGHTSVPQDPAAAAHHTKRLVLLNNGTLQCKRRCARPARSVPPTAREQWPKPSLAVFQQRGSAMDASRTLVSKTPAPTESPKTDPYYLTPPGPQSAISDMDVTTITSYQLPATSYQLRLPTRSTGPTYRLCPPPLTSEASSTVTTHRCVKPRTCRKERPVPPARSAQESNGSKEV